MLFVNFYFRWKVLKIYNYLRDNQVAFGSQHIISPSRLEKEILPHYPAHREQIVQFITYVRFSVKIASILIVLITTFGLVLMYYSRHEG